MQSVTFMTTPQQGTTIAAIYLKSHVSWVLLILQALVIWVQLKVIYSCSRSEFSILYHVALLSCRDKVVEEG